MNIANFVIDRPLRGMMLSTDTGEVMWSINQIENPSLTVSAETSDAVDALGTPIMSFDRSKSAEFSAENSLFDLGLFAAQSGTDKIESTASATIATPCFFEFDYASTVTLPHTPNAEGIPYIYVLNGDGTLGDKYAYAASSPSGSQFTFSGTTLTMPSSVSSGRFIAIYEYDADATDQAMSVVNTATDFPRAGKFVLEVLGCDVCNVSKLYYAYVVFPQAKLTSDFDLSFTTDAKHGFTLKAMQAYCDHEKKLFYIVIPEAEEE